MRCMLPRVWDKKEDCYIDVNSFDFIEMKVLSSGYERKDRVTIVGNVQQGTCL